MWWVFFFFFLLIYLYLRSDHRRSESKKRAHFKLNEAELGGIEVSGAGGLGDAADASNSMDSFKGLLLPPKRRGGTFIPAQISHQIVQHHLLPNLQAAEKPLTPPFLSLPLVLNIFEPPPFTSTPFVYSFRR